MAAVTRHGRCRRALHVGTAIGVAFAFGTGARITPIEAHPASTRLPATLHRTGAGQGSGNPACAVLSAADVRTITGFPGYRAPSPGDPPGHGAGGGASCQFEGVGPTVDEKGNPVNLKGPLLSIVLIEGRNYTHTMSLGNGCRKEPAPGVGDEAFFEVCPTSMRSRTAPLYVKTGARDLILQMDIDEPDTEVSLRPRLIALAKAAAARLR